MEPVTKYVTNSKGLKFFIRQWLPATAPKGVVFLLHGLSDHGNRFAHVAASFNEEGYVFFAPDLRGNGNSKGVRGHMKSIEQAMEDIDELILYAKESFPNMPLYIFSQSMGGNLALNYILRNPDMVDGAIVSSPWLRLTRKLPFIKLIIGRMLSKLIPWFQQRNELKSYDLCHDETICNAYDNDPLIHWKISLSAFFSIKDAGEWAIKNAHNLQTHVLLLHSQTDAITSYSASEEFFKRAGSKAEFRSYTGLFHELHNETARPEILKGAVNWIASL